ncbi:MAG: hypothetical protein WBC93_19600 [Sulfitobacter sp.]
MGEFDLLSIALGAAIMFALGAWLVARAFLNASTLLTRALDIQHEVEKLLDEDAQKEQE